jgi:CDP-glucose 4,6-dehydratase
MGIRSCALEGVVLNPIFWYGKRILLTGHTGFKGSWLTLWLESLGARLVGYALAPPTNPSLFEVAELGKSMTSVIGDIRDLEKLQAILDEHRPEIVIHMAAQPLVRHSYIDPVETYSTNMMGTVNLLEAVRHVRGVKAVVNITTDKCYQNREWVWPYREEEPMGGYDPYSSSKACSELVTAAYRTSFFNPDNYLQHGVAVATVRAGNVIGGGDWAADRLIPDILGAFERNEAVKIRNPNAVRPWQHVLEPLCGYLTLAERMYEEGPAFAEAWNFGPRDQDAKSVGWIVDRMIKLWGDGASSIIAGGNHPHEANCLKLDISKACSRLGWSPVLNLEDALKLIVDWSKQRLAAADMRKLSLAQIGAYQKLVEKK